MNFTLVSKDIEGKSLTKDEKSVKVVVYCRPSVGKPIGSLSSMGYSHPGTSYIGETCIMLPLGIHIIPFCISLTSGKVMDKVTIKKDSSINKAPSGTIRPIPTQEDDYMGVVVTSIGVLYHSVGLSAAGTSVDIVFVCNFQANEIFFTDTPVRSDMSPDAAHKVAISTVRGATKG